MLKKKIKACKFFTAILVAVFFPGVIQAGILVNEIMYDLPGSDDGREWVEIKNDGAAAFDLKDFRFFNKEGGHLIKTYGSAGTVIESGALVVLSDVPDKFLADWPNFVGILLDSSFSLVQSDTVGIKDENGNIVDSVSYDKSMGAAGDGNSLSRSDSTFVASSPTPGAVNGGAESSVTPPPSATAGSTADEVDTDPSPSQDVWKAEPQIYAEAGPDRTVMAGVEVEFKGQAFGLKKEPLLNARHLWNFGDGVIKEGKNVSHIFKHPGEYAITLDVSSGEYSQGDMALVTVLSPELHIGNVEKGENGYVEIINKATSDADISGFKIGDAQNIAGAFTFSRGTIILAGKTVRFSNAVTNIAISELTLLPQLLYPNGSVVAQAPEAKKVLLQSPTQAVSQIQTSSAPINKNIVTPKSSTLAQISNYEVSKENVLEEINNRPASSPSAPFVVGLLAIIGITSGAVLFIRRNKNPADEYEIIE